MHLPKPSDAILSTEFAFEILAAIFEGILVSQVATLSP